jgi:hypothetical protein
MKKLHRTNTSSQRKNEYVDADVRDSRWCRSPLHFHLPSLYFFCCPFSFIFQSNAPNTMDYTTVSVSHLLLGRTVDPSLYMSSPSSARTRSCTARLRALSPYMVLYLGHLRPPRLGFRSLLNMGMLGWSSLLFSVTRWS